MATARTWRGGEQQVLYLLSGLSARGLAPRLAAPPESPLARRAREQGIEVVPLRSRGDLDLGAAAALRRAAAGADLLHLHTGHAHALGLLATVGIRPRPAVVVARRVDFPIRAGFASRLKYGPRVDRFVAVSHAVARVLEAGGVPRGRITVVHSGVDPARFAGPGNGERLRADLAIPRSAKLVGFVGALVPHKAPGDLLEALAGLPPEVHGVLVGTGELETPLRRRAAADDLSGRVHFLGQRDDVPALLPAFDVFCLPSRQEGLGTSVLDAMAAGTPVVATLGGGIPEMVVDGECGLLAPAGDPEALRVLLLRVLTDRSLAGRLVAGGRERITGFTADRMVEKTLGVYEDTLSRGSGRERTL